MSTLELFVKVGVEHSPQRDEPPFQQVDSLNNPRCNFGNPGCIEECLIVGKVHVTSTVARLCVLQKWWRKG